MLEIDKDFIEEIDDIGEWLGYAIPDLPAFPKDKQERRQFIFDLVLARGIKEYTNYMKGLVT